MRCADEAMYAAKQKGKNSFHVYRPGSVATGGRGNSLAHPPQDPAYHRRSVSFGASGVPPLSFDLNGATSLIAPADASTLLDPARDRSKVLVTAWRANIQCASLSP